MLRQLNPGADVEAWLNQSAEARVLEVHEGRWQFAHDKLREAVIAKLSPEEQKALHRHIGEGIEQIYAANLAHFYPRLAHHWSQVAAEEASDSEIVSKAVDYLQRASKPRIILPIKKP